MARQVNSRSIKSCCKRMLAYAFALLPVYFFHLLLLFPVFVLLLHSFLPLFLLLHLFYLHPLVLLFFFFIFVVVVFFPSVFSLFLHSLFYFFLFPSPSSFSSSPIFLHKKQTTWTCRSAVVSTIPPSPPPTIWSASTPSIGLEFWFKPFILSTPICAWIREWRKVTRWSFSCPRAPAAMSPVDVSPVKGWRGGLVAARSSDVSAFPNYLTRLNCGTE